MIPHNFQAILTYDFLVVSGTLAFGDNRIVYKNGHFTFETMADTDYDQPHDGQNDCHGSVNDVTMRDNRTTEYSGEVIDEKSYPREATEMHDKPPMRRQYAKTTLGSTGSHDDVFYNEEYELESVKGYNGNREFSNMGQSTRDVFNDTSSSRTSINSQASSVSDRMEISTDTDSYSDNQKLSSSSLPEVKEEEVRRVMQRAKRTSSFRQAQEVGALRLSGIEEDKVHFSSTKHYETVEENKVCDGNKSPGIQNNNSSTFIKKMMARRKSSNDGGNLPTLPKQNEPSQSSPTKDFFSKKMNLKGLFKKNKSESSISVSSPVRTSVPSTPPIAAFSRDDDIDSIDTPPSSPFAVRDFRRRHTSADIYPVKHLPEPTSETDSNCPTPTQERSYTAKHSVSNPVTPSHDSTKNAFSNLRTNSASNFRDDDVVSITSASSLASSPPMEQPNKPKTPKPVGASPRRNPSCGSHLSRLSSYQNRASHHSVSSLDSDMLMDEMHCECEQRRCATLGRINRRRKSEFSSVGSSDSLNMCQYCKLLEYGDSAGFYSARTMERLRKPSLTGRDKGAEESAKTRTDSLSRNILDSGRLGIISQTDVASSNSNDSGIQRDASVHSSSESVKVSLRANSVFMFYQLFVEFHQFGLQSGNFHLRSSLLKERTNCSFRSFMICHSKIWNFKRKSLKLTIYIIFQKPVYLNELSSCKKIPFAFC